MIATPRLRLVAWNARHRAPLAAMHADAEVMWDYGGALDADESRAKFLRFAAAEDHQGSSHWAIEDAGGNFLGYAGVTPKPADHPLGAHWGIGWRLVRDAWGHGYATEAARATLTDVFARTQASEVLAYTAPDNLRSQAVMARLGMVRDAQRDFTAMYDGRDWHGLVWTARRPDLS